MANRGQLAARCRKTKMCKFFMAGACERGEACAFAHNQEEMRAVPDLRCTQVCPALLADGKCEDEDCKFAHDLKELRSFPGPKGAEELQRPATADHPCPPTPEMQAGTRSTAPSRDTSSSVFAAIDTARAAVESAPKSQAGALAAVMAAALAATASVAAKADDLGKEGAEELRKDLAALRQMQTAFGEALATLEHRISKVSSTSSLGFASSMDGSSFSDAFHGPAELGVARTRVTFRSDTSSESGDPDSFQAVSTTGTTDSHLDAAQRQKSPMPCWQSASDGRRAFDRQVSINTDFGPVFDRQTSGFSDLEGRGDIFGRAVSDGCKLYEDMGLCVKNTFLTFEDDQVPLSPVREIRRRPRANSAPPPERHGEGAESAETVEDTASSQDQGQPPKSERISRELESHAAEEEVPVHAERSHVARTLPAGARKALHTALAKASRHAPSSRDDPPTSTTSTAPLPAGPVQAGPVLLGEKRRMAKASTAFHKRAGTQSAALQELRESGSMADVGAVASVLRGRTRGSLRR